MDKIEYQNEKGRILYILNAIEMYVICSCIAVY